MGVTGRTPEDEKHGDARNSGNPRKSAKIEEPDVSKEIEDLEKELSRLREKVIADQEKHRQDFYKKTLQKEIDYWKKQLDDSKPLGSSKMTSDASKSSKAGKSTAEPAAEPAAAPIPAPEAAKPTQAREPAEPPKPAESKPAEAPKPSKSPPKYQRWTGPSAEEREVAYQYLRRQGFSAERARQVSETKYGNERRR